ncbi:phosphonate ABC transporter, permease protein PhnE [Tumebacillus permanentifrigoris]|uniref:Phosphonate transport system permease protein n=1 Tax=Tumebacillus permanentifrigoris TaxID=378543 RepID=A0A316D5F5_9BACL|nr:phosphonate ABC transporter, permease protein PhnE [Tumebacillus permanentifrigoris]PWK08997.1 phosphonate transport system permease protein [Tumebacillus permanentifrigoris]
MPNRFAQVRKWWLWLALLALLVWSMGATEFDLTQLLHLGTTFSFITENWLPPQWNVLGEALSNSLITLQIAFVGTSFGLVFGLLFSFITARTTPVPRWMHTLLRTLLSFIRSVPEIVWGLLFVPTLGLGPFVGVVAILLHNVGVLGKLIAELIEAAEKGPQEAIIATGGNRLHVLRFAVLPDILPNIYSQYFYRLEVAIRTSLVLGFIGAGGLGNMLFLDFKVFEYQAVAVEVLVIMLLVVLIDTIGGYVRKRTI